MDDRLSEIRHLAADANEYLLQFQKFVLQHIAPERAGTAEAFTDELMNTMFEIVQLCDVIAEEA